jgi:hypothetical protein
MAARHFFPLTVLLLSLATAAPVRADSDLSASAGGGQGGGLVQRLAASLRDAPNEARSDFALAVLDGLIEAYSREAERARMELRRGSHSRDLSRWVRAVDTMILDLQALLDTLQPATPVQISTPDSRTVYLIVDGSPVLLSGPRTGEQALLEQRVVEHFCSRNYCDDLLEGERFAPAVAEPADTQPPLWRFSDLGGPVCASGDGLELQFRDATDLGRKREVCTQLVTELRTLVAALRTSVASGTHIDWPRLSVTPDLYTGKQRLVLNAAGDSLPLSTPYLENAAAILKAVVPWLAAKVDDRQYNLVILNAETKLLTESEPNTTPPD